MDSVLIGSNLKHLRVKNKLSVQDLAEELNVSRAAIQTYENGRAILHILIRYKEKFNVSLDDMCTKDLSINP